MKRALIVGSADCVWDDLAALRAIAPDLDRWTALAVNRAGIVYPSRLDAWVSLHPDQFPVWRPLREGNQDYVTWSRPQTPENVERTTRHWGGSSAGLALAVALNELRCERVVLCGVPLDARPHFHDQAPWSECVVYQEQFAGLVPKLAGRVRSMSGWTRSLLGGPSPEWLAGEAEKAA